MRQADDIALLVLPSLPHSISPQRTFVTGDTRYFQYDAVHHNPFGLEEAKDCLGEFVEKLTQAIGDVHSVGWAHQDIHLANICFNEGFEPVFIDLDRCRREDKPFRGVGCMYQMEYNAFEQDWLQLGLLISWVTNPGDDYHSEERTKGNFDSFVEALIKGLMLVVVCASLRVHVWQYLRAKFRERNLIAFLHCAPIVLFQL